MDNGLLRNVRIVCVKRRQFLSGEEELFLLGISGSRGQRFFFTDHTYNVEALMRKSLHVSLWTLGAFFDLVRLSQLLWPGA